MSKGHRRAVIDIGSNTIRLVVFGGAPRVPIVLYNEKLMAGLGQGVIDNGELSAGSMKVALTGLARFKVLVASMDVSTFRVVATAAVRDASNGDAFLEMVHSLGLPVELLSGEAEAKAAGYGVISALPNSDGVVADLGGGSLELVRIAHGHISQQASLPIGILNVPGIRELGEGALRRHVQKLIAQNSWAWRSHNLPLYLVGGSWRSLARVHLHQTGFPLPIIGNHTMRPDEVQPLAEAIQAMDKAAIKTIHGMPNGRVPFVADASALLAALVDAISPSEIVTCAFGLREGLLYQTLDPSDRHKDPLIEGVRYAITNEGHAGGYGDALFRWLDGLFGAGHPAATRLRHAACLLVGNGWASNPDFRALSGEEIALHGNWIGVTAQDRAVMGMALYVGLGGTGDAPAILHQLSDEKSLHMARTWGLALRLAQRLSGGATAILEQSKIVFANGALTLSLPQDLAPLDDSSVRNRLQRLGNAIAADACELIIAKLT